jgi:sulfur-carrier protein
VIIRIILPTHLWRLANVNREIQLEVDDQPTLGALMDALETCYPMLRGTIRDHVTLERRPFIRFFACGEDLSLEPPDTLLPEAVVTGAEPLRVVGAMAGG